MTIFNILRGVEVSFFLRIGHIEFYNNSYHYVSRILKTILHNSELHIHYSLNLTIEQLHRLNTFPCLFISRPVPSRQSNTAPQLLMSWCGLPVHATPSPLVAHRTITTNELVQFCCWCRSVPSCNSLSLYRPAPPCPVPSRPVPSCTDPYRTDPYRTDRTVPFEALFISPFALFHDLVL